MSCGMRTKAKAQWADPESRSIIYAGIVKGAAEGRTRYQDLTEEHFTEIRPSDGRVYAHYWSDDGRRRTVYRYQWRWERAFGHLPKGWVLHHKNRNPTDDRLENLQPMTSSDHKREHMDEVLPKMMAARGITQYRSKSLS